jgi:uncharacterized protein YydD (DUF2326 family)
MEYCCVHGRHHPGRYYGPPAYYEPTAEERRQYLEDEKRTLERRLKEIEARMSEAGSK